ncbi:asparagine synthase-related protein [Pseudomonas aeruginosa]
MDGADDAFAAYRAAFFDRDHEEYLATVGERFRSRTSRCASSATTCQPRRRGRGWWTRRCALDSTIMLVDDPVKRVDNMTMAWGLEARVLFSTTAWPSCRRAFPPASQGLPRRRRQAGAQGCRAQGDSQRSHRPAQGLLGARPQALAGPHPRNGYANRCSTRARTAACSSRRYSIAC